MTPVEPKLDYLDYSYIGFYDEMRHRCSTGIAMPRSWFWIVGRSSNVVLDRFYDVVVVGDISVRRGRCLIEL